MEGAELIPGQAMPRTSDITFEIVRSADPAAGDLAGVRPVLGIAPLEDLAFKWESEAGYTPSGSYGPRQLWDFRSGADLRRTLLGQDPDPDGRTALLGCNCGETGCWPLCCRITVLDETVIWDSFRQPHRPAWHYEGRTFAFARRDYSCEVEQVVKLSGLG